MRSRDHLPVELGDHATAGAEEQEGEQRVHEASDPARDHAQSESTGYPQMLCVRLADGLRMLCK
jgi:hypothetical protein